MKTLKQLVKSCIPPVLLSALRRKEFRGRYANWEAALADCPDNYSSDIVLERVQRSLAAVRDNAAVYERDSVLFEQVEYSYPLLTGLLLAAQSNNNHLSIIDFGGSLGSTYFQNRLFLKKFSSVRWNIIEQPNFVTTGKAEFQSDELRFFGTIDECMSEPGGSNVLLLSSVLQYLESPIQTLIDISQTVSPQYIIIDRTPLQTGSDDDELTVQHVPNSIYPGICFPCWLLSRSRLLRALEAAGYSMLCQFESFCDDLHLDHAYSGGFLLERAN